MRKTRYAIVGVATLLLASAELTTPVRAQDGYDQQQWWNPGDWFDSNPQYNLFSDRYWNNHRGEGDTWDSNPSNDYGYYDTWDYDSDYGYNNDWDDGSDYGDNGVWDDNNDLGVGSAGSYESGTTGGTSQSRPAQGQQVTSLRTLVQSDRPMQFVGDQVNLRKVEVQRVVNANWIIIGTPQEEQLLVRLPQAKRDLNIGDTVKLSGVVRKIPQNLDQLKLTKQQVRLAEQQDIYIDATRVNTLDQ